MAYGSNITLVATLIGGLVGLAVGAVPYVFSSLGLYRILQNRGVPNPWMAWVPVANYYAQGAVADDINLRTRGKTTHLRHWLLFLGLGTVGGLAFFMIFYFGFLFSVLEENAPSSYGLLGGFLIAYLLLLACSVAYTVFYGISLYRLYLDYCPQNAVLYTVLSLVISLVAPFLIFSIRNNRPLSLCWQPQAGPYGMPPQYAPYYQNGGQPPYGQPPYGQPPEPGPSVPPQGPGPQDPPFGR